MSPREQKLLTLFAVAGFVMLNLLAISYYRAQNKELESARFKAERELQIAQAFQDSRDQALEEMEWLAEHEPKPAENQDVRVALVTLCRVEAQNSGLELMGKVELMPSDTNPARHYHRAKARFVVSGTEQALYSWFDRINVPSQLRAATKIRLSPNKEDDTLIDCTAIVEQWFVPATPST